MSNRIKETVYRLILGKVKFKVNNQSIEYTPPCADLLYEAELFYNDTLNSLYYPGCISRAFSKEKLTDMGYWDDKKEKEEKEMPEQIKEVKIKLYEAWKEEKATHVRFLRKHLELLKGRQRYLFMIASSIDSYTVEYLAHRLQQEYIILRSVNINGRPINQADPLPFYSNIVAKISELSISPDQFKKVARDYDWWCYYANGYFNNKLLNEEQQVAISTTKCFESAYKNPDCPPEEVLDDPDLFDGWLELSRKENEGRKLRQKIDSEVDSKAKAVFIPAKDMSQAKKIHEMNSDYAKNAAKSFLAGGQNGKK